MKIVGIIAEFNPFHNGHKYLVQKAKELTKADAVICIMSGNFTQAGNIAIEDKFKRAKVAIANGIDVVIELPTIYATSSAETFASNAVKILNDLHCVDYLCFGSETGDTDELVSIVSKLVKNNDKIWEITTENMRSGISFADARQQAISEFLTLEEVEISTSSNNILAIEYIKELMISNSDIRPIAIKREENDLVISATKIRELAENSEDTSKYLPGYELEQKVLNKEMYDILKYAIISKGKERIEKIAEVTEGLENRIVDRVNESESYDEFIQDVKSKRYQLSKIKRIMTHIILDIYRDDVACTDLFNARYAHVLAVNPNNKKELLSTLNKNAQIPVLINLNDNLIDSLDDNIKTALKLDIKASNIHAIFTNNSSNMDYTNKI